MKTKKPEKINISVGRKTLAIIAVVVVIAAAFAALPMLGINLFAPSFKSTEEVGRAVTNISSDVQSVIGILDEIEKGFG
jgi:hypothetical protein